jgi:hypothetical protein
MKVEILTDDPCNRFKKGEIGKILNNDFKEKYDYYIELPGKIKLPDFLGGGFSKRRFYFHKEEIKLL